MALEQSLPANATGSSGHDDIVAQTLADSEFDARLGDLAGGENDYTPAQLREQLGEISEGMTDEELTTEWAKARESATEEDDDAAPGTEAPPIVAPTTAPFKLEGFKLFDAKGAEIKDPTKVSALDLLTGKVQVGYNALSKEQRKSLRDLTRVASLGHYNEKVLVDTRAERAQAMQRAVAAESQVAQFNNERRVWDTALTALVNGNPEPIQRLAVAYQQALAQGGAPASNGREAAPADDSRFDEIGQQFFNENIVPRAQELATQYGANAIEIAQYVLYLCEQEGDFLTPDKIQAILQYEMPAILEGHGYAANGKSVAQPQADGDPRDKTIADLTKRLTALEAGKTNASTERLRGKTRKAPPSGGGSTPGGGETMPADVNTREKMRQYLRGELE